MKDIVSRFKNWYEKHYTLNVTITAILFGLQLAHLYWLTTDVVAFKLLGESFFPETSEMAKLLLVLVDYVEIPAIITTTILYLHLFKKTGKFKNIVYIFLLNIQIIHILWITDEVVVQTLTGEESSWSPILAWIAIGIDYLELPVIFSTIREAYIAIYKKLVQKY